LQSASPPSRQSGARRPESIGAFPPDWHEFIGLLSSNRVRFVVVGAHALAAAGRPRATQDLDILVDPTERNAERLGRALRAFGFPALADQAKRFSCIDRMATLGRPPLRIDIMTSISGITFADAWTGRRRVRLGRLAVPFLGRRELVKNKSAAGRPKDLADIALLDEIVRPPRSRR
jgi:hypothetical protein